MEYKGDNGNTMEVICDGIIVSDNGDNQCWYICCFVIGEIGSRTTYNIIINILNKKTKQQQQQN